MPVGLADKVEVACLMGKHDTIGIDCVALCVNELLCAGARPTQVRSWVTYGKRAAHLAPAVEAGLLTGGRIAGCEVIPCPPEASSPAPADDRYLITAVAVGDQEREPVVEGVPAEGDLLIGLCASGIHADSIPLVRRMLETGRTGLDTYISELSHTLGEELLRPTRVYTTALDCLRRRGVRCKAAAHIVGGLYKSLSAIAPPGLSCQVDTSAFPVSPIFEQMVNTGYISHNELYQTFHMGVGMVIVISREDVGLVKDILCCGGERTYIIGSIVKGDAGVELF
ncbi:MAG: phosphoribosylformylglycinamidine cyclo-ligase [Clostridiales bacterium]|nr:phosphoribosylformylglycinamidine cyclo-ligase [Clostridiales bacterium]